MLRPVIVMLSPQTRSPQLQELVCGFLGIWVTALHAAGADLFVPYEPLDPGRDPFAAMGGVQGLSMTHDGDSPRGLIDALVCSDLVTGPGGSHMQLRILRPGEPDLTLAPRRCDTDGAALDAMMLALRDIADAVGLDIPPGVDWRALLGAQTEGQACAELRSLGRTDVARRNGRPPATVH